MDGGIDEWVDGWMVDGWNLLNKNLHRQDDTIVTAMMSLVRKYSENETRAVRADWAWMDGWMHACIDRLVSGSINR